MEQSKTQSSKQDAPKSEKEPQVEPMIDYGFRWHYLLFPFLPSWLIAKSLALLFWHLVCSFFEHDDSHFASVYTEDRSNRIVFLVMLLFLLGCLTFLLYR